MFWNIKIVAIILNVIMFVWAIKYIIRIKLKRSLIAIYSILLIFILIFIFSLFQNIDQQSAIIFFKVFFSVFLFIIGLKTSTVINDSILIAKFSVILVLLFLVLSFAKIGYQYWGDTLTFSGLYYFKTDLALAVVICVVYILYFSEIKTWLKILFIIGSFYLIFISNARMHLLTFFLTILFYFFRKKIIEKPFVILVFGAPILLIVFLLFLLLVETMVPAGLLHIDLENFYSESNTQGRSVIWETLLTHFNQASMTSKLFGLGLTADVQIYTNFGKNDEVYNSHNGFLYLLISCGYIGCIIFLLFTLMLFKRFITLTNQYKFDRSKNTYLMMFLSHSSIFYLSNLSNVNLIFQQQTWFFFFWAGILFNIKYLSLSKSY